MSDNRRRYRAIRKGLKQLYPKALTGNLVRHLDTLADLISGIVSSKSTNLPHSASRVPDGRQLPSREKRFVRWLHNERIDYATYYLPFAQELLASLSEHTVVLVMDGSEVGRHCLTLMLSVVYQQRALPLVWLVVQGSKGHFPEDSHLSLLEQVQPLLPANADVIFLGDGEFDGVALQTTLTAYGWEYVCRTAKNIVVEEDGAEYALADLEVEPGERLSLPAVTLRQHHYGPLHAIAWWQCGYQEPIYLLTNLELVAEACYWYRRRCKIETFFSDQKSRGFHLHKSHLSDPTRLTRLMIAACLAYIWIIYLGILALQEEWRKFVHRTDRCDLSLFQLGLRLLDHLLNENKRIPLSFQMSL
jgi:hypothetical protein